MSLARQGEAQNHRGVNTPASMCPCRMRATCKGAHKHNHRRNHERAPRLRVAMSPQDVSACSQRSYEVLVLHSAAQRGAAQQGVAGGGCGAGAAGAAQRAPSRAARACSIAAAACTRSSRLHANSSSSGLRKDKKTAKAAAGSRPPEDEQQREGERGDIEGQGGHEEGGQVGGERALGQRLLVQAHQRGGGARRGQGRGQPPHDARLEDACGRRGGRGGGVRGGPESPWEAPEAKRGPAGASVPCPAGPPCRP